MATEWLFDGLKPDPSGIMPLSNLSGKNSASIKSYRQVASYNWVMDASKPCIVIPGLPKAHVNWNGARIESDSGLLVYDINHLHYPIAPMDPLFQAVRILADKRGQPVNFQEYDFVTDAVNLQKLFAFCKGDQVEGMFRIDLERIGNLIIATRVEGGDLIPIDFETFDKALKTRCTKAASELTSGPFEQIASYQFGNNLKILVRYDADCALEEYFLDEKTENLSAKEALHPDKLTHCEGSDLLHYVESGESKTRKIMLITSYPAGRGFPAYTYAQMLFSGADILLVGMHKGTGDMQKPASYPITEINKLLKPLPIAVVSKVHDCITKLTNFMRKNEVGECSHVSLMWRGMEHIEIYERSPEAASGISEGVRQYLQSQVSGDLREVLEHTMDAD